MNIRKLCSTLAKLEKTKSQAKIQAKIQAIRSIVGHLSDILWNDSEFERHEDTYDWLLKNGMRRARGKKK